MFGLRYLPDVVTLTLDAQKCNGCGMCRTVCPHAVFDLENKKSRIADRNACMECGACARNCPESAISVRPGVGCATAVIAGAWGAGQSECACTGSRSCRQ